MIPNAVTLRPLRPSRLAQVPRSYGYPTHIAVLNFATLPPIGLSVPPGIVMFAFVVRYLSMPFLVHLPLPRVHFLPSPAFVLGASSKLAGSSTEVKGVLPTSVAEATSRASPYLYSS